MTQKTLLLTDSIITTTFKTRSLDRSTLLRISSIEYSVSIIQGSWCRFRVPSVTERNISIHVFKDI